MNTCQGTRFSNKSFTKNVPINDCTRVVLRKGPSWLAEGRNGPKNWFSNDIVNTINPMTKICELKLNWMLFIATVLDPRYKLEYVEHCVSYSVKETFLKLFRHMSMS